MFRKLFAGKRPRYGAVVFDAPGKTFRDEQYPAYKANRPRMDDDLRVQLSHIDALVEAHGFPILRVTGYEADDVIGTLTQAALAAGHEVLIVSGDKDFAQLLGERVRMLDTIRDVTYEPELAKKKWGVPPEQFVDYLALCGDKVDNIPGVPGIGKKGAAQLLEAYGSLDGILANTADLKGKKRQNLEEHREAALISRALATIKCDVPLELGLDDLVLPEVALEALDEVYRGLEFYSLLSDDARVDDAVVEATYEACLDATAIAEVVAACRAAPGPVAVHPAFDREQVGPDRRLVGLALAVEAGRTYYVPLAGPHAQVDLDQPAAAPLRALLEDPQAAKVVHDAKALWVGLVRLGVTLAGVVFDLRIASYLIDPTQLIPHRLDQLSKQFLHRTIQPLKQVVGSGKKLIAFEDAPLAAARDHAGHEAHAVIELLPLVEEALAASGLRAQHDQVDLPLAWVLGEMERVGIRVDVGDLDALGREFREELAGYEGRIHELAGRSFNINSTKQLSVVLFEELQLPVIKRTKTGYSTNVEVLERLQKHHPIAEQILEYRSLAKLINTYTDVLSKAAVPETSRIHATFQQTVAATGRLISTEPDLQRTPVKTPRGERIRRAFVPEPGWTMIAADWSQIELRFMAHVSEDPLLIESFQQRLDVHARTAGQLFDKPPAEVTTEERRIGKTINFATIYGQGATALGQILKIPRKDAANYIDRFFTAYGEVKGWIDETTEEALANGYVTTLLGRRRMIPELSSNNKMMQQAGMRIAANTPLQGSVADICKLSMLQVTQRLRAANLETRLLLQIHDELLFEAPPAQVEASTAIIREVMESVVELKVPLVVDVGVGASWAACK